MKLMLREFLAFIFLVAIWVAAFAIADNLIPLTVARCWITVWGVIVAGVALIIYGLITT